MKRSSSGEELLIISEPELMRRLERRPWWHAPALFFAGFATAQLFAWALRHL